MEVENWNKTGSRSKPIDVVVFGVQNICADAAEQGGISTGIFFIDKMARALTISMTQPELGKLRDSIDCALLDHARKSARTVQA